VANRIYAYTVVGKDAEPWERIVGQRRTVGQGLIKVGQTTKRSARERIKQQLGTAYPNLVGVEILLDEPAVRDDGTEFTDHEVHVALVKAGIRRPGGEWFEATLDEVRAAINKVRLGIPFDAERTDSFGMRPEQSRAVELTARYFRDHAGEKWPPKFLWNAKMRFGKTFTTYQLTREMGWTRVLVLTYKPAVQTAWRDDLLGHVDFAGWHFVDRDTPINEADELLSAAAPVVRFASFQDLNGKSEDGKVKAHNESIHLTDWDCIALDEYHFGAWRDSARDLYDPTDADLAEEEEPDDRVTEEDLGLEAAHYLYLSGTPFRAITNGEFTEDATFDWTYVDEQAAKGSWDDAAGPNPYVELPGMEMYTYGLGADAVAYAQDGEFAGFSLSEYFKASKVDKSSRATGPGAYVFDDPARVSEFLEMLRGKLSEQMKMQVVAGQKPPFPYESPAFTDERLPPRIVFLLWDPFAKTLKSFLLARESISISAFTAAFRTSGRSVLARTMPARRGSEMPSWPAARSPWIRMPSATVWSRATSSSPSSASETPSATLRGFRFGSSGPGQCFQPRSVAKPSWAARTSLRISCGGVCQLPVAPGP